MFNLDYDGAESLLFSTRALSEMRIQRADFDHLTSLAVTDRDDDAWRILIEATFHTDCVWKFHNIIALTMRVPPPNNFE